MGKTNFTFVQRLLVVLTMVAFGFAPNAYAQPNDMCANAEVLVADGIYAGTTTGSTDDTAAGANFCGTSYSGGQGVWYTFTTPAASPDFTTTVSTCNIASYDTKITVYSGACGALICETGNDDGPGCAGFSSDLSFVAAPATTYLVLVHGFLGATGDFNLAVDMPEPPPVFTACVPPVGGVESNVLGTSASFTWTSLNTPVDDHCWNFYIGNVGFDCDENEEFISATVCDIHVGGAHNFSTNNANVNIASVNDATGVVSIDVTGLQPGTFYEWNIFETCDGNPDPNAFDCNDAAFGPFQTWDDPYTVATVITPATCPTISPGFVPDGSFDITIGDSPTCAGTYDLVVQAGGAQATFPVTPVSHIGVAAGTYSFANAGPGTYTVIITETSVCHPSNDPETVTVIVPEGTDTEDPIFYVFDILGNIIVDNDPGTPETDNIDFGTYNLPEGSCNYQEEWFIFGFDNCDNVVAAVDAVTSTSVTTPGTIFPATQTDVTNDNFGTYRVDVNWSVGTTTITVCMTDAAGNTPCVDLTRFLDDYGTPDVTIVGANNTTIPHCATDRAITVTVYVDADCDQSIDDSAVMFNVGPNSTIDSRLELGGYVEFVVTVTAASNGEIWNASYSDGLDVGFADVQITVVQAAADQDPIITAADDNATIAHCEDAFENFCYSFQIYDDCAPVDAAAVTFDSDGSGLAINFVEENGQTNVTFFEACGNVASGSYIFTIEYNGSIVVPFININQEANQAAAVTLPGNLNFTMPVCTAELITTIAVQINDDCDSPIDGANLNTFFAGVEILPTFSNEPAGYFEYTITLTAANDQDLLFVSFVDSDGALTQVDALFTVTDQPDTWAPIIIYPSQDIVINLDPCDPMTAITFFEVTATDNCDGDNVPVFNLQLFTLSGQLVDAAVFFGIGGPTVGLALAAPGEYVVVVNAEDNAGNTRSEDFHIIVNQDPIPDVNLACLGAINLTLNDDCVALLTPSMVLTGEWGCLTADDFIVTVVNTNPADNGEYAVGCGTYDYVIELAGGGNVEGFTGPFAPANWSVMQDVGDNAKVTFSGSTMTLETLASGPFDGNDFQFNEIDVMAMIAVPGEGTISFDYDFNGYDDGWDWYVIDVAGTIVAQSSGPDSGSASQAVSAGDVILFGIDDDGLNPVGPNLPSLLVIDNFFFDAAGADAGDFTTCWGTVTAEDKTAPTIVCPDDTNSATVVDDIQSIAGSLAATDPTLVLNDYSCFQEAFPIVAENNHYDLFTFTVNSDDYYTFFGVFQSQFNFTGYLFEGGFDAQSPCSNIIAGNNNSQDVSLLPNFFYFAPSFRVSLPLQAGQTYTLMTSASTIFGGFGLIGDYLWNVTSDGNGRINGLTTSEVTVSRQLVCTDLDNVLITGTATYATYGNGATIPGTMNAELRAILDATGRPTIWDNCGDVWVEVTDELTVNGDCGLSIITRTFNIHDRYNKCEDSAGFPMTASCTQIITVRQPSLNEVVLPPFTSISECDEEIPVDANGNPSPSLTGYPYIQTAFGVHSLNETYCNMAANYTDDARIDVCDGTYKIVRRWSLQNWCEPGEFVDYIQLIKVGDYTAPEVACTADGAIYSTGPFDCFANFPVPAITVTDNCSSYEVTSTAYTIDPEVPVYNEFNQLIGYTTEKVLLSIDNGYVVNAPKGHGLIKYIITDDCGNVAYLDCAFEVKDLVTPIAVCDDNLNISIGGSGLARVYAEDIDEGSNDNCTEDVRIEVRRAGGVWGEYVDFDCADVHNFVTVELRVWDDANCDGIVGNSGDLSNLCWLEVLVEDKINPYCYAPANDSRHCDDPELLHIDWNDTDQLNDVFGAATATDNCEATAEQVSINVNLDDCGWGTIVRTFRAVDGWGLTSLNGCQQIISIYEVHNYEIKFPRDAEANCGIANPDSIAYNTLGCDLITVNVSDERFIATSDECYKVLRTYKVINWCEWDGESNPIVVGRNEDGDSTPGDEDVWVIVRTTWNGNSPIYTTYYDRDNDETNGHHTNSNINSAIASVGHWQYTQVIKVYDNEAPTAEVAVDTPVYYCSNFADCTGDVEITFTITELCDIDEVTADGTVDLYADGVYDDDATVTLVSTDGNTKTYTISGNYVIGSHAFGVHIEDGCHNITWLEIPFEIVDCKAPTPICIAGLTVTLMPQPDGCCAMAIWATDFIGSAITDCTEPIKYSIIRLEDDILTSTTGGTESPSEDQVGIVLDCNDTPTTQINIYAWDSANNPYAVQPDGSVGGPNYDRCETYVLVQQHVSCEPVTDPSRIVAGSIMTEEDEAIQAVNVDLSGNTFQSALTESTGGYEFESVTIDFDYTVTPHLDVQAENSISTFDLVLITKHILGIQLLDSPYKIIAADVNSSETVTTADMIQLRKLILGIYSEYPNNTFFRFVDADYNFPDATNPWAQTFPEVRNIAGLAQDELAENFIGVAIGDVNGSAVTNFAGDLEERTVNGLFALTTEDVTVKAGADYSVSFTAADLAKVAGYQFTLTFDQSVLSLTDIEYGVAKEDNFGLNYVSEGMISTSWNGEAAADAVLFTLVFHANAEAQLSELLGVSSRITLAEAYDNNGLLDVAINFTNGKVATAGFEVYQNTPNPFTESTMVGFNLPEDAAATVTIQDVTGKTLQLINVPGVKGYNTVSVKANGATGVLYYTVSTDNYTATKKMIVVE